MMRAEEIDLHEMSLADKLDASTKFDLEFIELQPIADKEELQEFLSQQRDDYYSESDLRSEGIISEAEDGLQDTEEGTEATFLLAVDKPDDFQRNDEWGHTDLFKAVIFSCGETLHIHLVERVKRFAH